MTYCLSLPWLRRFCAALLCLVAHSPLLAAETITLCYENVDIRPWATAAGTGLNFELLERVAKKLDIKFVYQSLPWKRCLAQLKANEVGGVFSASYKLDRLEMGIYPGGKTPDMHKRLHTDRYVVMRRTGSPLQWDGKQFTHLDGAIGSQLGYSVGDFLRSLNVTVDEGSHRAQELLQKLAAGRLAGAALLEGEAKYLLQSDARLSQQIDLMPTPLIEKPYYLMLSRQLVGERPAFAQKIWDTIAQTRESETYQKLERAAFQ